MKSKKIFISHSYPISDFIVNLQNLLSDYNYQVVDGKYNPLIEVNEEKIIFEEVLRHIKTCDIVIVVLDKINSNIIFEAGIAAGLNKEIILLSSENIKVPYALLGTSYISLDLQLPEIVRKIHSYISKLQESKLILQDIEEVASVNINNIIFNIIKNPDTIFEIDHLTFESIVALLYKDYGYDVEIVSQANDFGIDIVACKNNELTLIECKHNSLNNKIGINIVQRVYGILSFKKATKAIIISSSYFTSSAINFAENSDLELELVDFDRFYQMLINYKNKYD